MGSPSSPYKELGINPYFKQEEEAERKKLKRRNKENVYVGKTIRDEFGHQFGIMVRSYVKLLNGKSKPKVVDTGKQSCRRCGGIKFAVQFKKCPGRQKKF